MNTNDSPALESWICAQLARDEHEHDDAGIWTAVASTLRQWDGRRVEVDVLGLGTTAAVPGVVVELRGRLRATGLADDPAVARFEVGDGAFVVTRDLVAADWLDREHLQLQVRQAGVAIIVDARQLR